MPKMMGTETGRNLLKAFAGESEARNCGCVQVDAGMLWCARQN
jgi:hypothetical protein